MPGLTVLIVSDIHYASAEEQARPDYELRYIPGRLARCLLKNYRKFVWLHRPLHQNHLLDQFLDRAPRTDLVVANGDYSVDTAFVGISDDAACRSARECLQKLRQRFANTFHATIGDHELGKFSMMGNRGGLRLESWRRAIGELELKPFWRIGAGRYELFGVVSSLLALPAYEPETLPEERAEWYRLREAHLEEIRGAFEMLPRDQRVILFCHDPTALPFLYQEKSVRARVGQIEQTVIGHLHSPLIFGTSRLLAGMPSIHSCGNTVLRLSTALGRARAWQMFRPRLCPSLAGIELLKDGGYLTLEIDPEGVRPVRFFRHRMQR